MITRENVEHHDDGHTSYIEVDTQPDSITRTNVTRSAPEITITNCYCCSCYEDDYGMVTSDPACRNHGFAAQRPCELHNMPGQPWDDYGFDTDGKMPESVQQKRADDQRRVDEWKAKHGG